MKCEIVGDEAQFQLGESAVALHLVFTRQGLENLMAEATGALAKFKDS